MARGNTRSRLRVLHRAFLARVARDITNRMVSRSALVVAPHPDDETLGCGATIIRKAAAGTPVRVVVVSDGEGGRRDGQATPTENLPLLRRDECREACGRLGLATDALEFLGVEDGELDRHLPTIEARLRAIIEQFQPEEVFAPAPLDAHADHRAVAMVIDRLRWGSLVGVDVYAYPVWYWNRWAWTDRRESRAIQIAQLLWRPLWHTLTCHPRRVDAHGIVEQKRYALDAHRSQVGTQDSDDSFLDRNWLESFLRPEEIFFALQEPRRL
jgi:LmbE family N-acetylglucosaminyl deacetylase